MRILGLDSSTEWLSVAAGDGTLLHERVERAGTQASQHVLGFVDEVLREAGWTLAQLDGIAFGAGPGSFTGLRIACGVAQGLALGAGLPVCPVSTLEAVAHAAWRLHRSEHVVACLDARMREVYLAAYRCVGMHWETVRAPEVRKPEELAPIADAAMYTGAGDGFAVYPQLARRLALADVRPDVFPAARDIAEIARARLAAGECVAAADAHPIYVRHRVALTAAERDAGARL